MQSDCVDLDIIKCPDGWHDVGWEKGRLWSKYDFWSRDFRLFPDTGLIGMTDSLAIRLKKGLFPDGYSMSNCKDGKTSVSGSKDGYLFGTSKHLTWNCKREGKAAHKIAR